MQREQRWPAPVAAILTFGAGALDVLTLTHLGQVFASVMTGNLALMGLGIARTDSSAIVHTVVAVVSYAVGVVVGTRITGVRDPAHPVWPRRVTLVLAIELVVLCALTIGWVVTSGHPAGTPQLASLAAAAASMGLQGAAVRGLGVPMATTYLTGTLTVLIAHRTTASRARDDTSGLAALIAAVAGAACGGLTLMIAPSAGPLLCVGPVAGIVAAAAWRHRKSCARRR